MTTRLLVRILVGAGLLCLGATTALAQFNSYYLTHLGASGDPGHYMGLNQAGEVAATNGSGQAFLYSNGTTTILEGATSYGTALNDNGQVALQHLGQAQIYTRSTGQITNLGSLGGGFSFPFGINGLGTVVGQSIGSDGQFYPFLDSGGVMFNLGSFGATTPECAAYGVNSGNQAVGVCLSPSGHVRAFYTAKGLRDFDPSNLAYDTVAFAVNDSGAAVGSSNKVSCGGLSLKTCTGAKSPVLFFNGTIKNLGKLAPGDAWARGINNPGDIVGLSAASGGPRGFIYTHNVLYDLNAAGLFLPSGFAATGWVITEADAINDNGQILGIATNPSGTSEIVLLTPLPVTLLSLTVSPNPVTGGNPVSGTVTLNRAAPPGGITVFLSSSSAAAQVPSSVTISNTYSSVSFPITTSYVGFAKATITASYGTTSRSVVLTIMNPGP